MVVVVTVVIVVVIIPVAFGVPAVAILIPPAVISIPAVFASFPQFVAGMLGLLTLPAVVFRGFVQAVIGLREAVLTLPFIGARTRCSGKHQKAAQGGSHEGLLSPGMVESNSHLD
jgi:hypothetical protein